MTKPIFKDKTLLLILLIIIILGVYIRFIDYEEVGYWGDDIATVPAAVLYYYPHDYFPGLSGPGEPPLGHKIIGKFCLQSGEDFSGVSQINKMFYPGRTELIGKAMSNSSEECHRPMYLFGILFFIAIIILAILLLPKYSAIYTSAFFAFFPFILRYSRWLHVDIIMYFLNLTGILFLWLAFKSKKQTSKETVYFITSFAFFGLALATKMPSGFFLIFASIILLIKYKEEFLSLIQPILKSLKLKLAEKIKNKPTKPFLKLGILSAISYLFFLLLPYNFQYKNIFAVYNQYRSIEAAHSSFGLNTGFLNSILQFNFITSIWDALLFIFGIYILYNLLKSKNKSKNEKFILYLWFAWLIALLFFQALNYIPVFILFSFGIIFLNSLAFSDKKYSLFNKLKIKSENTKKIFFMIFIIIYIISTFTIANNASPHFETRNSLCNVYDKCYPITYSTYSYKKAAEFIESSGIMTENDTIIPANSPLSFYLRQEDSLQYYLFNQAVRQQLSREPIIQDYIDYYRPNDRFPRFFITSPSGNVYGEDSQMFIETYQPNYIIRISNQPALYIFDLFNLQEK